jgi:uncharacterized protein (DUF1501 family)
MKRREFLQALSLAAAPAAAWAEIGSPPARGGQRPLLILVELKGGNDGLNTVVPYADPKYRALRPRLGIERDAVLKLTDAQGLHPALARLLPVWEGKELAIVQGVGYPQPNLSHFRSIEIWDTASKSEEYLDAGWLARAFTASPSPAEFATEGVVVGAAGMGPLAGSPRSVALTSPEQFLRDARLAGSTGEGRNAALAHLLRVENAIAESARKLHAGRVFATSFPAGGFGNAVRTAAQLAANPAGIAAVRITLNGFDTHANQPGVHAALLTQLGNGLAALRDALKEIGRWDTTVVATYSEFGRRPAQNESNGTDHGTVSPHFVMGGKVRGGMYGEPPRLERLDGSGNLAHAVDFRDYYATFLAKWWGIAPGRVLGAGRPLEFLA